MSEAMHLPVPGENPQGAPGVAVPYCASFLFSRQSHDAYIRAVEAAKDALTAGDASALRHAKADVEEAMKGFRPCVRVGDHRQHRDAAGHEWSDEE